LGLKTEKPGVKSWVRNGGQTEILGAHIYPLCTEKLTPMIRVEDAVFSGACIRETNFCNKDWPSYYTDKIIEEQNGTVDTLTHGETPLRGLGSGKGYSLYTSYIPGRDYPGDPVNLEAEAQGWNLVFLEWEHSGENIDGFILQRKLDDHFITIDTLSPDLREYLDTGLPPITEIDYRIIAFNTDGYSRNSNNATATTPVISVNPCKDPEQQGIRIFPNPSTGTIHLNLDQVFDGQPLNIVLYHVCGQLMFRNALEYYRNMEIYFGDVSEGQYLLIVNVREGTFHQPLSIFKH
jgi:hypothetical protein